MFATGAQLALRKLVALLLIGAVAGIITMHMVDPVRSARLKMLQSDHERIVGLIAHLERENEALHHTLRGLQNGGDEWRSLAHREFGMLNDGEVIFRFPVSSQRR